MKHSAQHTGASAIPAGQAPSIWLRLLRGLSQAALIVAGLVCADPFGHLFVAHDSGYWVVWLISFVLIISWNDILKRFETRFGWLPLTNPESDLHENQRDLTFRLFFQAWLFLLLLIVLDRIAGRTFFPASRIDYWVDLVVGLIIVAGWYDLAESGFGRRVLQSTLVEKSSLIFMSLVVLLIAVELFLRTDFSRYHLLGIWPKIDVLTDPKIGFSLNPDGYRDVAHGLQKTPGVTRIVLIGDSWTAGYAVSAQDYYPARLRELAGPGFEFIVIARPGIATDDEVKLLRRDGCKYMPDVVVVGGLSNDAWISSAPNAPPDVSLLRVFSTFESKRSFNPALTYFLDWQIMLVAQRFGRYSTLNMLDAVYDNPALIDYWKNTVKTLASVATDCGVKRLYAFTLPDIVNYSDGSLRARFEHFDQVLTDGFREGGFITTNLLPAYLDEFGDTPFRTLWALPNDAHPNPDVHRWFAQQIWRKLEPDLTSGSR